MEPDPLVYDARAVYRLEREAKLARLNARYSAHVTKHHAGEFHSPATWRCRTCQGYSTQIQRITDTH